MSGTTSLLWARQRFASFLAASCVLSDAHDLCHLVGLTYLILTLTLTYLTLTLTLRYLILTYVTLDLTLTYLTLTVTLTYLITSLTYDWVCMAVSVSCIIKVTRTLALRHKSPSLLSSCCLPICPVHKQQICMTLLPGFSCVTVACRIGHQTCKN